MSQLIFKGDSGSFKVFLSKFEEGFKRVSTMFLGFFLEVSRKFHENVQGVSKKFHVACHSSHLPEQKEGLCYLRITPCQGW